jgi:hypothetical protein
MREKIVGGFQNSFACVLSAHRPDGFYISVHRDTPLQAGRAAARAYPNGYHFGYADYSRV